MSNVIHLSPIGSRYAEYRTGFAPPASCVDSRLNRAIKDIVRCLSQRCEIVPTVYNLRGIIRTCFAIMFAGNKGLEQLK